MSSMVAAPVVIPSNSVGGLLLLRAPCSVHCCGLFGLAILTGVKGYVTLVLICTYSTSGFLMLPLMLVVLKDPVGANRDVTCPALGAQSTSQMLARLIYASRVCNGCVLFPIYRPRHKWCERHWEFLHITVRVDETRASSWKVKIHFPRFLETTHFTD